MAGKMLSPMPSRVERCSDWLTESSDGRCETASVASTCRPSGWSVGRGSDWVIRGVDGVQDAVVDAVTC
eukprot:1179921-Rhodomonas_salina.1